MKEDGRALALPTVQAILRSQMALAAAKGGVRAQRAVLAAVQTIEHENAQAAELAAQKEPLWRA